MIVLSVLGAVLVLEGLAFALAPSRLEDLLKVLAQLSDEARRLAGLLAITAGLGLIWIGRLLG